MIFIVQVLYLLGAIGFFVGTLFNDRAALLIASGLFIVGTALALGRTIGAW